MAEWSLAGPEAVREESPGPGPDPVHSAKRSWGWRHVGLALGVVAAFAAGMVASDLRGLRTAGNLDREVPPVEEFLFWDSFSEVDQTRALLRALCLRSIAEIRVRYLERRGLPAADEAEQRRRVEDGLTAALRETRDQIADFEGTAEEWLLHGELLRLLMRAERHGEWLDAYVDLVQRNPTDGQIEAQEPRAREMARQLGRGAELEPVLEHWAQLPWNRGRHLLTHGAGRSPEPGAAAPLASRGSAGPLESDATSGNHEGLPAPGTLRASATP